MGRREAIWELGLWIGVLLAGAGCTYRVREGPKLPLRVEVENPGHLRVTVVGTGKRALAAPVLGPDERAGYGWDHMVNFSETGGVGVRFREVRATVRSLSGVTATRTIALASRVEPQATTPISVNAMLTTSHPEEPENLAGVQELVFLGQDDHGVAVRVVVRIPLE